MGMEMSIMIGAHFFDHVDRLPPVGGAQGFVTMEMENG
jgi:hypothetical protein